MATITNSNWGYEKPVEGDSQATAPSSAKVQPVILDGSLSEGSTGNGNIGYDTSRIDTTDVNTKLQSIVFTEPDGSTTKPYEVENPEDLGTSNEVVVWIFDSSWATDDTVAFNFYSGGGDGTDYSNSGTGANPWSQTGVNAEMVQHLQDSPLTATDSTANNNDGTVNGATATNGEFDGAASFDGTDDVIDTGNLGDLWDSPYTIISNFQYTDSSNQFIIFSYDDGNADASTERAGGFDINNGGSGNLRNYFVGDETNLEGTTSYNIGENVHGAVTYDGSTSRLYGDGDEEDSVAQDLTSADISTSIGALPSADSYGAGVSSELRIYSEGKSSDWIQSDFDASPKGGQIFFNANQGSTTDQVGSVVQTNNEGVVQTTANGVIKTEP